MVKLCMRTNNFRIFLIIVFIGSVLVDMYTGYFMHLKKEPILQLTFKGLIILYSLPYLIRGKKASNIILAGIVLLLINTAYWIICGYTNLDRSYTSAIARLIYPYCLFLVLYSNKNKFTNDDLLHFVLYYGVIASFSILLLDFFNLGAATISAAGYGVKGFFAAGNDIALSLLLCACISSYYASSSNKIRYFIYNVIIILACFRLGARAATFGSILLQVLFIIQPLLIKQKLSDKYPKYRHFILYCGIPLTIYGIFTIVQTNSYMMQKYNISAIVEGSNVRDSLIEIFYKVYSKFSVFDKLFGVGIEELYSRVGFVQYNTNRLRSVEVDHLELIAQYGYILGFAILIFPAIYLQKYAISFLKRRQIGTYWLSIALLLYITHGFLAGHAYTSIQASTIMIGLLFYEDKK